MRQMQRRRSREAYTIAIGMSHSDIGMQRLEREEKLTTQRIDNDNKRIQRTPITKQNTKRQLTKTKIANVELSWNMKYTFVAYSDQ